MLPSIQLADTGRTTSQLGLGCSGLGGSIGEKESVRLLEVAYDAGVRHFDVAPSYGHGAAERCLGRFLRGKHPDVTVTTKYGILPPKLGGALDLARKIARPITKRLPAFRKRVANAASGLKGHGDFSIPQARASLDRSLQELGLERVDVWLLHEATVDDLTNDALLEFLEDQVRRGRIGTFGIGSEAGRIPAIWENQPRYCRVLQSEWPGFASNTAQYPGAFRIHHRVVQEYFLKLSARLEQNSSLQKIWSDAVDLDLANRQNLIALLLKTALLVHPERIVLFSSRIPAHIQANIRAAADAGWDERAQCFYELVSHWENASLSRQ
ncbi:MAG TPA: aldo/keto reductase [Acidobacteriaceae bacterium]|jgi:hypothetical protein|nr:aldo/keto reductase [Acidobacteriaceae bacterium]